MSLEEAWQKARDEHCLLEALIQSDSSPCLHRLVGAVIVKDDQILGRGFNRPPSGFPVCQQCLRKVSGQDHGLCMALHAEQIAMLEVMRNGGSVKGSTLYLTHQPCSICAKLIIESGIQRVVFMESYPDSLAMEMLRQAHIEAVQL